jgi:transaldolase
MANRLGCGNPEKNIITVTNDVLKKISLVGRDLAEYPLDTVELFCDDGRNAGYTLTAPTLR